MVVLRILFCFIFLLGMKLKEDFVFRLGFLWVFYLLLNNYCLRICYVELKKFVKYFNLVMD